MDRLVEAQKVEPSFNFHMPWRVDVVHGADVPMQDCAMYPGRPLDDPFIRMPLKAWLSTNTQGGHELVAHYMLFEREDDALLFLMTFKSGRT